MTTTIFWTCNKPGQEFPPTVEMEEALSPAEEQHYRELTYPKRRAEWLLARWTAKSLLKSCPNHIKPFPLRGVTIAHELEGAPYFLLDEAAGDEKRRFAGCLSLSHSQGHLLCALAPDPTIRLGVDVERIEKRDTCFAEDYFTLEELGWLNTAAMDQRETLVTLIWSVKEAALKSLGKGLRLDTRRVEVGPPNMYGERLAFNWEPLGVKCSGYAGEWRAWARREADFILSATVWSPESPLSEIYFQEMDIFDR